MPPPGEGADRKVPRRRFLRLTGALVVAGAAGVSLGYAAGLLNPDGAREVTSTATLTSTATGQGGHVTETTTETATQTRVDSVTQTQFETETVDRTVIQTETTTAAAPVTQTATSTTGQTGVQPATSSSSSTASSSATSSTSSSPIPPNSFSIFWITDTQFLSETNPAVFTAMTNWISDNWAAYNGKLVIHTGDLVQTGNVQAEWSNADDAMSVLLDNGIPYTWCAGNHDDLVGGDESSGWMGHAWTTAMDPAVVQGIVNGTGYASWVGDYHYAMNTAAAFTANGLNFLVINVEWNADSTVVAWVKSLLDNPAYADHRVIIAPHAYMDAYGLIDDPRWGSTLADFIDGLTSVMNDYSSRVFLTLNGHFATDQGYNTPSPVNDRNQLMFDRQDCTDAPGALAGRGVDDTTPPNDERMGGATVTILNFDTDGNRLSVSTYDTYTGAWRKDANEQYELPLFAT
ncbi:MAG: metallophosphoesterase [Nitrososphaerales archaeon]